LILLYDVTNKASFDNIKADRLVQYSYKKNICINYALLSPALSLCVQLVFMEGGCALLAWLTEIHEYAQQDVVLMLLGNKADVTHERVVKREEGEKLAKVFGVPFMETSAKSGLNVELAFTAVAKELKHRSMKEPDEPKFQLQDYVNKEMNSAGCCHS
ncbi:unnamed protein product, partial [Coregonus sp. 'balchen']